VSKHEYAFDVKLFAIVRVEANSLVTAKWAVEKSLSCADLNVSFEDKRGSVKVTDASVEMDDVCGPELVEVDGEYVYEPEYEEKDT